MIRVGIFLLAIIAVFPGASKAQQQPPELFTYAELVQLYEAPNLPEALQAKLDRLLTTPFISNATSRRAPGLPRTPQLGSFVRVAQWNIERGIEFDAIRAALADAAHFAKLIDPARYPLASSDRKEIFQQVALMKQVDVIVLN